MMMLPRNAELALRYPTTKYETPNDQNAPMKTLRTSTKVAGTLLKKISIIYYLQSLTPVPMSDGPFAFIADPVSGWVAVPGLLVLTIVILIIASYRIRRMEIKYTSE